MSKNTISAVIQVEPLAFGSVHDSQGRNQRLIRLTCSSRIASVNVVEKVWLSEAII
jgi:hypothetical protein